jgi:transcriptional regulator with XRE-family HTH domain
MSTPKNHQSELFLWERILALMNARGLNAKEIAEIAGVVPSAVAKWKAGGKIGADKLQRIAEHFGESVDWLLGRDLHNVAKNAKLAYLPQAGDSVDLPGAGERHVIRETPGSFGAPPGYHLTTWQPAWSPRLGGMMDEEIVSQLADYTPLILRNKRGHARASLCHGMMDLLNELANRKENEGGGE